MAAPRAAQKLLRPPGASCTAVTSIDAGEHFHAGLYGNLTQVGSQAVNQKSPTPGTGSLALAA
eukprot:363520-Chlamydomonas_euryale.AAC.3